jgi:hypothetical protein
LVWAVSLLTMKLSSHCLTPVLYAYGIQSLIVIGNLVRPLTHSVLYLHMLLNKASPKAISRRTSYLRVRLEFLRYPQVIRELFNVHQFGPPLDFTPASTCSWIDHSVSGLLHDTIFRPIKTRFPFGSIPYIVFNLASYK